MGCQTQVVVRRQIHHGPAVEPGLRALFALEDPQVAVQTLLLEHFELVGKIAEGIDTHARSISARWRVRRSWVLPRDHATGSGAAECSPSGQRSRYTVSP